MGKNFANVKKKTRFASVFTSLIFGIGIGAIVLALAVLVYKYFNKPLSTWFYILGAVAAAVSFAISYFIIMPSDKRLAKRLDREHSLNEKMRTMVELKESDAPFAVLQREDADEKLGKIKYTPWRKKQIISLLLIVFISAASLTTAFVIPSRAEYVDPEKPLSEFDKQWILAELSDIISSVEASFIADGLKEKIVNELNSLVDFVKEHEYLSEMKIRAIKSVIGLNRDLTVENTAPIIGEKLSECTNPILKELGTEFVKLNGSGVQAQIVQLEKALGGQTSDDVTFTADELGAAISASGASSSSDLTVLLSNLASALRGYAAGSGSVSEIFENVAATAMEETMIQSMNGRMTQTVISRLCALFGIGEDDLSQAGADEDIDINPPADPPSAEDPSEDDDKENEEIGSGGIGTGDRVYGSNDMIYNPYTDKYVPYGEVFDEYNNKRIQMVQDGRIAPDFEDFLEEYFRSLSDYNAEETIN